MAAPQSGAPAPVHSRKRRASGAIATSTCSLGRGRPGKLSLRCASSSSVRASGRSEGKATRVNRPRSRRSAPADCAGARVAASSTNSVASTSRARRFVREPRPIRRASTSPRSACPRIELVGREPVTPHLLRLFALAIEPERAAQLVVRLDEIRPERERLPEECLRVLVHLALAVHESEIEVRIERRLAIVVESYRLREMLDCFPEDALLEADVAEVDARERIGGLPHQHFLEVEQRLVVLLLKHLRPAEQRLGLRIVRRELERPLERALRALVIAERDEAPSLLDERRCADVIGHHYRAIAPELRCDRRRGALLHLLPLLDELLDVLAQRTKLCELELHLLEERDDLAFDLVALARCRRGLEARLDRGVARTERRGLGLSHATPK